MKLPSAMRALAALATATPIFAGVPAAAQEKTIVSQPSKPPVAEKRDHTYSHHGITISDPYHWLRDQGYPTVDDKDVLDHLKAENAWFEARMKGQQPLIDTLFEEMKGRIKEDDSTVPQKDGDWLYWSEFEKGAEYRKHYRRPVAGGDPVLILDENELAKGKEYFRLGSSALSKDGRVLAYSFDDNGSERFRVRFKCLDDAAPVGEEICGVRAPWGDDAIEGTMGGMVFTPDGTRLVYGLVNENWRVDRLMMHTLGTPQSADAEVYREEDEILPGRRRVVRSGRLAGDRHRRQ